MSLREFKSATEMMDFYRDLDARIKAWAPRPPPPPAPEPEPEPTAEPAPPLLPLTPIRRIVLAVAQEFDMPAEMICSRTCVQSVVVPRHVVVFLAKKLTNASHYQIGKAIGHRDHSSIGNSVASLKGKMTHNPALAQRVERLRCKLLELGHLEETDNGSEENSERARDCGSSGQDADAPGSVVECPGDGPKNL